MTSSDEKETVWYPDLGATSHITTLSENIQYPRAYNGNIYRAGGSPLPISYTGQSRAISDSNNFILHDLLPIPTAIRNFLSVNKFCVDNNVCIEFDSQKVQVDSATKTVLLEGAANSGLYELPMVIKPGAKSVVNLCYRLIIYGIVASTLMLADIDLRSDDPVIADPSEF